MKRGILLAGLVALVASTTTSSCRRAADPRQLATVDSLITAMEAARLTLNELDTQRYAKADSVLQRTRGLFLRRFNDTLDKATAAQLGAQFVELRETGRRGMDHRATLQHISESTVRLKRLRSDMVQGALQEDEIVNAMRQEARSAEQAEKNLLLVIENHQATGRSLQLQLTVDSLLADTLPKRRPRR
ncbi:MAG TPA: hypothetical protein PL070_16045 [Flavobacteriales bacterium]|nr:hypothetical protein [Flavobacteriales bacterium]